MAGPGLGERRRGLLGVGASTGRPSPQPSPTGRGRRCGGSTLGGRLWELLGVGASTGRAPHRLPRTASASPLGEGEEWRARGWEGGYGRRWVMGASTGRPSPQPSPTGRGRRRRPRNGCATRVGVVPSTLTGRPLTLPSPRGEGLRRGGGVQGDEGLLGSTCGHVGGVGRTVGRWG